LIHPYNDIPYKKKIGTVNAYDNYYIEIIVKLRQKNSGTYDRIVISKDIVILSIIMRRFCCIVKLTSTRNRVWLRWCNSVW
jgi:hypothetical protein